MIAYLIAGAVLVAGLTAAITGIYLEGKRAGKADCQASAALIQQAAERAREYALNGAATAISNITVKHTTVRQELEREVLTREVFRDCRSGPDAVRLLNSGPGVAASGVAAGGPELPASGPAR